MSVVIQSSRRQEEPNTRRRNALTVVLNPRLFSGEDGSRDAGGFLCVGQNAQGHEYQCSRLGSYGSCGSETGRSG